MEGTLEVQLTDQIRVYDLQALLFGIDKVYFSALWLDLASSSPPGVFSDSYAPAPDEEVWIASLEIGTPNRLKLKGKLKNLAAVATFLTTILGTPVALTEAGKNIAEAKQAYAAADQARAEADKARAEAGRHTAELVAQAWQLYREGKISKEALRHKLNLDNELVDCIVATPSIVPPQTFAVVPVVSEFTP